MQDDRSQPTPRWQRPVVILTAALVLRGLLLLPALGTQPYSDEIAYHGLAERLATGLGYVTADGRPTSWRPPLWPAVLAGLYRLTGPDPAAARWLQVILGTLLVGVVMLLASAVAPDDRRVRSVAGWWAALSPTMVYYSHSLFSESLFGICLGLGLFAVLRCVATGQARWAVAAGLTLGLTALCRGSILLLLPPLLVWLLASCPTGRRHGLRLALVVATLCGLVIAPWSLRNKLVHGQLIVVDSNGPVNLFYGNNPETPRLRPWDVVELDPPPWPMVGADAGEPELQRRAIHEAALFIQARPDWFLTGLAIKTGNLWGLARGLAGGVGAGLYGDLGLPGQLVATALAGADGLALLLLGVLGLGLTDRRQPADVQILLMLVLTLVHAVSYGHSRYRFGALLMLFGFAALAAGKLPHWRQTLAAIPPARRRVTTTLLIVLVANWCYEVVGLELLPRLG